MFSSLRARLWVTYMFVALVVLVLVTSALLVFLARNPLLLRESESQLQQAANSLSRLGSDLRESEDLNSAIAQAADTLEARVIVFSNDGQLIADSHSETDPVFETLTFDSQGGNFPQGNSDRGGRQFGGSGQLEEYTDSSGQDWIFVRRNLQGRLTLILAHLRPETPIRALLSDQLFQPVIHAGLVALVLSIIFTFLVTRWIERPLQGISLATENVASGEYSLVKPEGPMEVKQLIQAFNLMSRQVKDSRQSQEDFVANVSHDLRTPLTSIRGFGQAILDGTVEKGKKLKHAAQIIVNESGRMNRLVEELLDSARFDAGTAKLKMEILSLDTLLESLADRFTLQANAADISMEVEFDDLPRISGDEDRLIQAFSNLIENALTHTPKNGQVLIAAQSHDKQVNISVIDSGVGMSKPDLERIFERFYQVDKARTQDQGHGSGLGLSIAKQIIEAHGGQIRAESEEGQGSSFVVHLPIDR